MWSSDGSSGRPHLVASLPENSLELARAAIDAGADMVKVHASVGYHRASGTAFGPLEQERRSIEPILEHGIPAGLVVGTATGQVTAELRVASGLPFRFIDMFVAHAPAAYVSLVRPACPGVAVAHDDWRLAVPSLSALGIEFIEASIVPPESYGTPLAFRRMVDYQELITQADIPVWIPSQHLLHPEDVGPLIEIGAAGFVLGAVVTGRTSQSMAASVAAFHAACTS